jgi:outer membrane protein TolC
MVVFHGFFGFLGAPGLPSQTAFADTHSPSPSIETSALESASSLDSSLADATADEANVQEETEKTAAPGKATEVGDAAKPIKTDEPDKTAATDISAPTSPPPAPPENSPASLSLLDCIDLALRNNLEIRAQQDTLDASFHKVREQFSQVKTQIGFQNVYSLQQNVPGFGAAKLGDKETSVSAVTLRQPVYSFGRLESGVRMVQEQHKAEEASLAATQLTIAHQVIREFLEVLKTRNRVLIANETLDVLRQHLELVERLLQEGVILNTDVSTTKVKLLEAQQRLIEERNSRDLAHIKLCNLLRLPEGADTDFSDIPALPLNASTTFENRGAQPEMRNLQHLIKAGKEWYSIEKRNTMPVIGLQWTYSTGNQFFENFKNWNANVVFDMPLYDSGSARARRAQAKANLNKIEALRDSAAQRFSLAIQQSARKVQEMQEKFALAHQIEATARQNFELLQSQFREGAVINTDVLSAQLAFTNARLGVMNAYYEYVAYLSDYHRSLGDLSGFLQILQTPPPTSSTQEVSQP